MLRRTLGSLLAVAVVVTSGACANKKAAEADFDQRNDEVQSKVSVILRGDLEANVRDRVVPMRIVSALGDDVPADSRVFGVEIIDVITDLPIKVKAGVALVPYEGQRNYTIPVGSPHDALKEEEEAKKTGKPRNRSSVKVEFWPADREPEYYLRREKPCEVEIEDGGLKGRVRCPQLTQEGSGGRRFSLDFRWDKP